jgi:hypothetical protein
MPLENRRYTLAELRTALLNLQWLIRHREGGYHPEVSTIVTGTAAPTKPSCCTRISRPPLRSGGTPRPSRTVPRLSRPGEPVPPSTDRPRGTVAPNLTFPPGDLFFNKSHAARLPAGVRRRAAFKQVRRGDQGVGQGSGVLS